MPVRFRCEVTFEMYESLNETLEAHTPPKAFFIVMGSVCTLGIASNILLLFINLDQKLKGDYKIPFSNLAVCNLLFAMSLLANVLTIMFQHEQMPRVCEILFTARYVTACAMISALLVAPLQKTLIFSNKSPVLKESRFIKFVCVALLSFYGLTGLLKLFLVVEQ